MSHTFMIVERFRDGDPQPVYQRLAAEGRALPDGLTYVASWVTDDLKTCYQVMRCTDPALLDRWLEHWGDLVEFEVHPVISSEDAASRVAERRD